MKKILFSTLLTIFFVSNAISDEAKNTKDLKKMSTEELMQELAKSEQELEKEKTKTKAVMKLGKTVDKLAKELNID